MRYRPCYIAYYVVETYNSKTGKLLNTRKFYQAYSRSLDSCGHRHQTEDAALPCLEKLKKRWSAWRSEVAKEAWQKRREGEIGGLHVFGLEGIVDPN
jgi:hypothetical protein